MEGATSDVLEKAVIYAKVSVLLLFVTLGVLYYLAK